MSPALLCRGLSSDACRRNTPIAPTFGYTGHFAWTIAYSWRSGAMNCWSGPWRCS